MKIAALAAAGLATAASAQVIDFEALAMNDSLIHNWGYVYMEDGFTLDHPQSEPFEFATFGTQESRYPGSTALFNNTVNGEINLREDNGNAFGLLSIDISNLNNNGPVTVRFTGFLNGNPVASDSFTTSGSANGLETFFFNSDFANVDHVQWFQESPFHQFDNITLIPAPASLALLGMGGLVATRRRR